MLLSLTLLATCALLLDTVTPNRAAPSRPSLDKTSPETFPIAVWHGLGDRYDNPGLVSLGDNFRESLGNDTFIYFIRVSNDSSADQKSTLFGNVDTLLEGVAEQLKLIPELENGFDGVGLSQGGVFLRAYVERYAGRQGYPKIRNLITLGSP